MLWNETFELQKSYFQNETKELQTNSSNNNTQLNTSINMSSSRINSLARRFSKINIFEGLPEPRNATEGKLLIIFCLLFITKFNLYRIICFIF